MAAMITIANANALHIPLPDRSVQCIVTSPPYFGLRDYGTAKWEGGSAECDHISEKVIKREMHQTHASGRGAIDTEIHVSEFPQGDCIKCGARRIDAQIGLESTPAAYVANIVAVMRECWRVLRDDGTLWLNLASSYSSGIIESEEYIMRDDLTLEEIEYVYQELAKAKSEAVSQVRKTDAPTE